MCVYIISKYQNDQSCLVDATQEDKLSNITTKMIVACLNYTELFYYYSAVLIHPYLGLGK